MVKFYEGGLSFEYASKLSYHMLIKLNIAANKINSEIKNNQTQK